MAEISTPKETRDTIEISETNLLKVGFIRLFSGGKFYPFEPKAEDMLVRDIIHSLGNQCRYSGHCSWFYSVLVHSLLVSHLVNEDDALEALCHDNTEPFFIDVPTPIKRRIPELKILEDRIMDEVAIKFGLRYPMNPSIKRADDHAFHLEWDALMLNETSKEFKQTLISYGIPVHNVPAAKVVYYERFQELYFKRHGVHYEEPGLEDYIEKMRRQSTSLLQRISDFIIGLTNK